MKKTFRNNSLTLVMFGLCFLFIVGQTLTGYQEHNDDRKDHHRPQLTLVQYLGSGHFSEAIFENWESEFLQMGAYVVFTVFLYQKGSSESKDPEDPDDETPDTKDPAKQLDPNTPRAVRKGGLRLKVYEHSLSLSLFALFLLSFVAHAIGGAKEYNEEEMEHGGHPPISTLQFMGTPQFWFQSFQNWQSEFLAVGSLSVLSIWFREKGSPESKAVTAPDDQTGD